MKKYKKLQKLKKCAGRIYTKETCGAPDVFGQQEPVLLLDVSTQQGPE
jgi:hypothetical protein